MSDEQTAEAVIHRYAIDVKAFDASGKSFGFTVRNRRCWQCQQDLDEMEVLWCFLISWHKVFLGAAEV